MASKVSRALVNTHLVRVGQGWGGADCLMDQRGRLRTQQEERREWKLGNRRTEEEEVKE